MKCLGRGFWQCPKLLQDRTASGKKVLVVRGGSIQQSHSPPTHRWIRKGHNVPPGGGGTLRRFRAPREYVHWPSTHPEANGLSTAHCYFLEQGAWGRGWGLGAVPSKDHQGELRAHWELSTGRPALGFKAGTHQDTRSYCLLLTQLVVSDVFTY